MIEHQASRQNDCQRVRDAFTGNVRGGPVEAAAVGCSDLILIMVSLGMGRLQSRRRFARPARYRPFARVE
jgi:hypothetical protein